MPRKLSKEDFINRAVRVHGDRYDYSLVEYKNNSTKVNILCKDHGSFLQQPNCHIDLKQGCPTCGRIKSDTGRRLTTEDFVSRARQIHGGRYDYSKVNYTLNTDKIIIGCVTHGDFLQEAYSHINRSHSGCPRCGNLGISNKSIRWLTSIQEEQNINIRHALNGGEFIVPTTKFRVDGYCEDTNMVYEFYGDAFHGNLTRYQPTERCHPFSKKLTAQILYDKTMKREQRLRQLGYNLTTIWETDFDNSINTL